VQDALALAKKHQNQASQSGEQVADQLRIETTALRAEIASLNAEIRQVQSQKEQVDERLRFVLFIFYSN
jgi:biotin operon repressor